MAREVCLRMTTNEAGLTGAGAAPSRFCHGGAPAYSGVDLVVGDPAAVEAERDPGGQVYARDWLGGEILGGEDDHP